MHCMYNRSLKRRNDVKKRVITKICMVLVFGLVIVLAGCGSEEGEPADTAETEEVSGIGTGVAGEKYTADFNGHTYQFLDEDTTWEEARKLCIAHGGHLATVTSAEEQKYLEGLYNYIYNNEKGPWFGAYSDGAYGGDKNDWCWVTGEKWNYTNWEDGEPSNTKGTEWFNHFWYNMKWNDTDNEDTRDSHRGYICEYDEFSDISEGEENPESAQQEEQQESEEVSDESAMMLTEGDPEEEEPQAEDPYIKDMGKGKYRICSRSREVYIDYPYNYYASAEGDALFAYDGDGAYVLVRNITDEAMEYGGDMKAFCKAKADEQMRKDFTMLFGEQTGMDSVKHSGGDGKNRVCQTMANIWNGSYDMQCQSRVSLSRNEKSGVSYLVLTTHFWKYNNKTSLDHANQFTAGSYHGK